MNDHHFTGWPERMLAWAVHQMPAERREWGAAMLAELALLRHPATRWQFAFDCIGVALFPPRKGGFMHHHLKRFITTCGGAALVSLLLVLPFAFLDFKYNSGARRAADVLMLFGLLWFLPTVFFSIAGPLVQTMRAGQSLLATPVKLCVSAAFLVLLAFLWGGLLADQLPCFLGYPNCD